MKTHASMKQGCRGSAKVRMIVILAAALAAAIGLSLGARLTAPEAPGNAQILQPIIGGFFALAIDILKRDQLVAPFAPIVAEMV